MSGEFLPAGRSVLRPDDPNWGEFAEALFIALGEDVPGNCAGDHRYTRRLLKERGYDVEASLLLYGQRCGYCDCEVLLNIDPLVERQPEP
jgi:hypothetical protein